MAKKILLISGHGAGDPGATAKIKGKVYKEAEETIVMVSKIRDQLASYDCKVELYPVERNAYEDAKAGILKKRMADYDYVLEVHFNACVNDLKGNGKVTGSEAYITTGDKTKKIENNILKGLESLGLKNRGVKSHNYTVISRAANAGADSCLIEICFIDDADDMKIYLGNKDKIAKQIAKGIADGLGVKKKNTKQLKVGAQVKVKSGAVDANTGKKYSDFVYKKVYTVIYVKDGYVAFGTDGIAVGRTKKENIILQ